MTDDDELDIVDGLSVADRQALAYMVASQTLTHTLPDQASLPLLSEDEHRAVCERILGIAHDLRDYAGPRGIDLYRAAL